MLRFILFLVLACLVPGCAHVDTETPATATATTAAASRSTCDLADIVFDFHVNIVWRDNKPCVSFTPETGRREGCYEWRVTPSPGPPECVGIANELEIASDSLTPARVQLTFSDTDRIGGFKVESCNPTASTHWSDLDQLDFRPTTDRLEVFYSGQHESERCVEIDFCFETDPDSEVCDGDPRLITKSPPTLE